MAENTEVVISVGTTVSVSLGAPTTYDISGFGAKTYIDIGQVTSVPDFGGAATVTEHIPLDTGIVNKLVGSINYGSVQVPMAILSDTGQAAITSGFDGTNARATHSFKLSHPDVGEIYFTGKISADQISLGDANTVFSGSFTIELTNKLIKTGGTTLYTLTYTAGANGSIVGVTPQIVASGEDGVAVYAAPDSASFVFDQWSDASTDNPRTDASVSGDVTVTASFVAA